MKKLHEPIVIELDEDPTAITPANAPTVPEPEENLPTGQAMTTISVLAGRRSSKLWRLFWAATVALVGAWISVAAWDFVFAMLDRNPWLGRLVFGLIAVVVVAATGLVLKEWLALARIRRVTGLRKSIETARVSGDLKTARAATERLVRFYRGRSDLKWGLENLSARNSEILDGDGLLALAERELMTPLDAAARREVEAAARQVALVTAVVPLALADVVTALFANLRMVRRIAEIYGGRAGTLGSWRLMRTVMLHLVATGAVAVGDDLISSVAGGGLLSKVSRRFGEGLVNGALTARVGVAAIEVCRPMDFDSLSRPKVSSLVKSALTGLFSRG